MEYTKKLKTKSIVLSVISWILCFGIAAALLICFMAGVEPTDTTIKEKFGTLLVSIGTTILILAVVSIIVKDKIEPTVWMANIILTGYLYGMTWVYIVFGVWFINTYIIKNLATKYKLKYTINKEIDGRSTT